MKYRPLLIAIGIVVFCASLVIASTYQSVIINGRLVTPVDSGFYTDIRYDPSDALPNYIGMNLTNGAAESASDWKVLKLTYSGSDVTRIQVTYGTWTDRTDLF